MVVDHLSLRHTAAEVLASAFCSLFPPAQLSESSVTDIDFSYTFILPNSLDHSTLPIIEERMHQLAQEAIPLHVSEMVRKNAIAYFKHHKQVVLADKLEKNAQEIISILRMGDFADICPPAHMETSREIGHFKLLTLESTPTKVKNFNQFSIKIRGTAFFESSDLKKFLKKYETAVAFDPLILGKELKLFDYDGTYKWLLKGEILKTIILNLKKSEIPLEPFSAQSSNDFPHGYMFKEFYAKNLPLSFTTTLLLKKDPLENNVDSLDLTYCLCTQDQALDLIISGLQSIAKTIKIFGFKHRWSLKLNRELDKNKKPKSLLERALQALNVEYRTDKIKGASKIEVNLLDGLDREWPGPFLMQNSHFGGSENLFYTGEDGQRLPLYWLVQSQFGLIGRWISILLEQCKGELPFWLAPEQIRLLPVGSRAADYATNLKETLRQANFRCFVDYGPASLAERIHAAETERIACIAVIGEKECATNTVTLREKKRKDGKQMSTPALIDFLRKIEIEQETK